MKSKPIWKLSYPSHPERGKWHRVQALERFGPESTLHGQPTEGWTRRYVGDHPPGPQPECKWCRAKTDSELIEGVT